MNTVRKEPAWKHATDVIVAKVQEQGFGFLVPHEEIIQLLDLEEPVLYKDAQEYTLAKLGQIDKLKNELLSRYSIHLESERGQGYMVVEPDTQVTECFDRRMKKVVRQLRKANDIVTHVQEELLSLQAQDQRLRNINKIAFLRAMSRKKKLPEPDIKQIEVG